MLIGILSLNLFLEPLPNPKDPVSMIGKRKPVSKAEKPDRNDRSVRGQVGQEVAAQAIGNLGTQIFAIDKRPKRWPQDGRP
jgi:hypothetical protein